MNMPSLDLFGWWALSISFSSVFLAVISIYLYLDSRSRRRERIERITKEASMARLVKNFSFVWVLLAILVFYILSIQLALTQLGAGTLSEVVFALGNIVVEALLVLYLIRNREKMPAEEQNEMQPT
jgi:Na+/H+ antiporter NhaC